MKTDKERLQELEEEIRKLKKRQKRQKWWNMFLLWKD
jgi:hypothetical protein